MAILGVYDRAAEDAAAHLEVGATESYYKSEKW
jgi:hypothetical protein